MFLLLPGQLSLSCRPLVEHGESPSSSAQKRSNIRTVLLLVGAFYELIDVNGML